LQLGKVLDLRRGPAGEVKKDGEEVKEENAKLEADKKDIDLAQSEVDHKPPDQKITIKREENIESAPIPPIYDNGTEDKSVTVPSDSLLPPPKKAKVDMDFDNYDDGGIADDDLLGLM
jgi:hypothetical protein